MRLDNQTHSVDKYLIVSQTKIIASTWLKVVFISQAQFEIHEINCIQNNRINYFSGISTEPEQGHKI